MLLHILSIELYNIELSPMYPNEVCIEDAINKYYINKYYCVILQILRILLHGTSKTMKTKRSKSER